MFIGSALNPEHSEGVTVSNWVDSTQAGKEAIAEGYEIVKKRVSISDGTYK